MVEEERDAARWEVLPRWEVLQTCEDVSQDQLAQHIVGMPLVDECVAGFRELDWVLEV